MSGAVFADYALFLFGIGCELVDRNDDGKPVRLYVFDMLTEVNYALFERIDILRFQLVLRNTPVVFQRLDGCDEHDGVRVYPRGAALDIEELLGSEVGAEARLRNDVIRELERKLCRADGVAAVRDVRERAAVDYAGRIFERLNEVRFERVLEQHGHRAVGLQVARADEPAASVIRDYNVAEAAFEVHQIGREAKNRHDLARNGDIEAVGTRNAVRLAAETYGYLAQGAVVHIDTAQYKHALWVDIKLVALVDVIVYHRAEEVVRGGQRVHIAGEMQIDILHRNHLRISAAGGAALYAENRPHRRLAKRRNTALPQLCERLAETDGNSRLALARGSRVYRRNKYQLAVRTGGGLREKLLRELRFVFAVKLEFVLGNTESGSYLFNRFFLRLEGDLDVSFQRELLPFSDTTDRITSIFYAINNNNTSEK